MGNDPTFDERLERRLVRRMLDGDRAAFDDFVARSTPALLRYARTHMPRQPDAAEDIVQTTLTAAIERLESFRGDGALGAWLIGICRKQIASHYRRSSVRDRWAADTPDDFDRLAADETPHDTELEHRERTARVHSTLDLLPPPYGQVLEWKYIDDESVKTIAGRLDVSPKAAESLLTRARGSFRRLLAPAAGELVAS
ncbi:MAG: sigma-70 family RNA polymerase sigma factor [Acidobacteriota bacterium]